MVSPSSTVRTFYTEMTSFRPCACQCQTRKETKGVSAPPPPPPCVAFRYSRANVLRTAAEIKFKTKRRVFFKTFLTKSKTMHNLVKCSRGSVNTQNVPRGQQATARPREGRRGSATWKSLRRDLGTKLPPFHCVRARVRAEGELAGTRQHVPARGPRSRWSVDARIASSSQT